MERGVLNKINPHPSKLILGRGEYGERGWKNVKMLPYQGFF